MDKKEPNLVLLIFTGIGCAVLFYYCGLFVCKMMDQHNYEKNKKKKEKWFDK